VNNTMNGEAELRVSIRRKFMTGGRNSLTRRGELHHESKTHEEREEGKEEKKGKWGRLQKRTEYGKVGKAEGKKWKLG